MSMDDIWNKRREQLGQELIRAALELSEHVGAAEFTVPVPGTTPTLIVELRQVRPGEFDIEGDEG